MTAIQTDSEFQATELPKLMSRIARGRLMTYLYIGAGLTLSYAFMRGSAWHGSATLHTVMEAVATQLALIIGGMALVRFYSKKNNTFLFIGTGFLGTAFLDGYHALVTSAFLKPFMPSDLPHLIPWSWVASRQFLSVFMLLSLLAWLREQRLGEPGRIGEKTVYLFATAFTLISFVFFAFAPLPRAYYPEIIFHRPEEFLPAVFFLAALVGYLRKGDWRHDIFEHWLVISLIVGFISQSVFMSFSGVLFDLEFDAAHTLKKVSYVCVLIGLLGSMYVAFRLEAKHGKAMALKTIELTRTNEELARSNEELQQFAMIASHDLQEPLRKVQAFGDRLKIKYEDVLDEQGLDYLVRMQTAAKRMETLINDLLNYARVTSRANPFDRVDLGEIITQLISDLDMHIQEADARIEIAELPTLDADSSQMRQLFQNLIGNAIKYRREGVSPVIHIQSVSTQDQNNQSGVEQVRVHHISIADNGIGFENEYADRIFGIFQRLHGRVSYSGTGVGLAICRKIVERHKGTISASGVPDQGATITIMLPDVQPSLESEL